MFKPIKSCPFCASDNLRIEELDAGSHKEFAVMCANCGAFGPNDLGQSGAVAMWDMRRSVVPNTKQDEHLSAPHKIGCPFPTGICNCGVFAYLTKK